MEFKFEEFMIVSSELSAEEREKVRTMLRKVATGAKQQFIGEKRREIADGFANVLEPERKRKLEEEISALHTTKDEGRFRTQVLMLLSEAFVGGMLYGQSVLRLGEQNLQKMKKDKSKEP